jgi:hypothetical protein
MTLAEFLLARIAEDEAVAQAAIRPEPVKGWSPPRVDDGRWATDHGMYEERVEGIGITIYDEGGHSVEQAEHIARYDPARVLADCEAKRRIVALHGADKWGRFCLTCDDEESDVPERCPVDYPCSTLRALALPYADHPDMTKDPSPPKR